MTNQPSDDISRKLSGLLRFQLERGATEAEVANALALAQKLALKHRINLSEFVATETMADGNPLSQEIIDGDKSYTRSPVHKYITTLLCTFFAVEIVTWLGGRRLYFMGRKTDVAFALYAYMFLRNEFFRLWYLEREKPNTNPKYRTSFFYGLYQSLDSKLAASSVEAVAEESAERGVSPESFQLAIVDDTKQREQYKHQLHPDLDQSDAFDLTRGAYLCPEYHAGRERGNEIEIRKPLPEGETAPDPVETSLALEMAGSL